MKKNYPRTYTMADTSLDNKEDITADLIEQTPIEKCSLNPRRGRNSRRLLTGFIIYASEVRKQVVEQYPDQNFGFISKLVGDKWKELGTDLRFKYHQRALIHNKRIKELAAREGVSLGDIDLASGSVLKAPKIKKKKLAAAREGVSLGDIDIAGGSAHKAPKASKKEQKRLNESSASTTPNHDRSSELLYGVSGHEAPNNNRQQQQIATVDTSTQTPSVRFVDPPPKKPLTLSDAFLKHLQDLQRQAEAQVYLNLGG